MVGAGQVRGLGVHLWAVLRPATDTGGRLPGGDRSAAPAYPGFSVTASVGALLKARQHWPVRVGANLGANSASHEAIPGDIQRQSPQVNDT